MRPSIFVDTSAWLALINKSDAFHSKTKRIRNMLIKDNVRFFVTNYVLVEIANSLSRIQFRPAAIKLIGSIQKSNDIEIVKIDEEIYTEAWNLYCSRPDKEWSLTDCASFVVMNRNGIRKAFTTDHHFEQTGFTILLKE